ncbi:hypothetical protein H4217_005086 [Coemansia sp. RSA 1939]|nr:hypothetical protein H4217_005086 [Coemansia sp. RSA 1939]
MQQLSIAESDQPKDAPMSTPRKVCTVNSASLVTKNYDGSEILAARKKEFMMMVDDYMEYGVHGILDLAVPEDEGAKSAARALANSISALVESLCTEEDSRPASNKAESSRGRRRGGKNPKACKSSNANSASTRSASIISEWVLKQQQQQPLLPSAKGKSAKKKPTGDITALISSIVEFKQWTIDGNEQTEESALYRPISQFFSFVASCIKLSRNTQRTLPKRLIVPFAKSDRKFEDGDDRSRVDIVLNLAEVDKYQVGTSIKLPETTNNQSPKLIDTFALIEVKTSQDSIDNAMPQLFRYSRGIYEEQYNRRFVWGLAVSGRLAKIVFFGPNYALASPVIDLGQTEGRKQLVHLLVNWSFCESHQLGYDPTIIHHREPGYYEIKVEHDGQTKTYYSEGAVIGAERLFGRHTRCFAASEERPVRGGRKHRPDRFIKDAWPEATEDADADYRDESRHLRKVTERLAMAKAKGPDDEIDLDGMYPRYDSGGRVRIKRLDANGECQAVEDTGKSILSSRISDELDRRHTDKMAALRSAEDESTDDNTTQSREIAKFPLRVHKRICMIGIGRPLKYIRNCLELICVLADVMECHNAIYKHCNILHRDMSTNNILFTGSGSGIKGMLIDFDHAICNDDVDSMRNFERSGTLPYMSITNLERGNADYSLLDEWESLIYIMCWTGSYDWRARRLVKEQKLANPERKIPTRQVKHRSASRQRTAIRLNGYCTTRPDKPTKRVSNWCQDDIFKCADQKRADLDTHKSFNVITNDFDKNIPYIKGLIHVVHELRKTLIDDPKEAKQRGALPNDSELDKDDWGFDWDDVFKQPAEVDPFKERAKVADVIAKKLLQVMRVAREKARELLIRDEQKAAASDM